MKKGRVAAGRPLKKKHLVTSSHGPRSFSLSSRASFVQAFAMATPKYSRMQLHPSDPEHSMAHAAQSLVAGFIGLDFERDVGDLFRTDQSELPSQQRDYYGFAHDM